MQKGSDNNPSFHEAAKRAAFFKQEESLNQNSSGHLSQDERQRIYEEEKVRIEAKKQIEESENRNACCGGTFILAAILLVLWILIHSACPSGDGSTQHASNWRTDDNSTMAYIMLEDFVKERLVSPGSARFPGVFDGRAEHITSLGNRRYRITSWVDSQNSFGAVLRTHFTAEIEQIDEDRWRLISLDMQ